MITNHGNMKMKVFLGLIMWADIHLSNPYKLFTLGSYFFQVILHLCVCVCVCACVPLQQKFQKTPNKDFFDFQW